MRQRLHGRGVARRVTGLALTLAFVLQPFALCCTARAAVAHETGHTAPHHPDAAHPDGAPMLMAITACTTGGATPPASRERPPDTIPAPVAPAAAAFAAQSDGRIIRAVLAISEPLPAHPTIPLRL